MITVDIPSLAIPVSGRVLDIGCGSGRHTAAAYDQGKGLVVGADPNVNDLQAARARLALHARWKPQKGGLWSLAAADILHLPFAAETFDAVICSEVLEHIPDHRRAISECVRVLRPGGPLVVSVPRRWPETVCWALSTQYRKTSGGHIRIYSAALLIRLIETFGVNLWRLHYAHGLHTMYWWLKCLLGLERAHLWPVPAYERLLTWDMMQKPRLTRRLEGLLNPIMGKSTVLYFQKPL